MPKFVGDNGGSRVLVVYTDPDLFPMDVPELIRLAEGTTPHTLHADGGASMISDLVAELLAGLGITRSRSRPQVSNDNPFSESLFKTIKYDLSYPVVFADHDHARTWIEAFLHRYHHQHRHSGLHGGSACLRR